MWEKNEVYNHIGKAVTYAEISGGVLSSYLPLFGVPSFVALS
jgi:hypothetical protein